MGRPPLALGTFGAIRFYKTDSGWRAITTARDFDGRTRRVERHGTSKAAAERALKLAFRDRAKTQTSGDITGDTRVALLAEAWFAGLSGLSPVTMQAYRDRLDRQIIPGLGELRVRELTVGVLDRHLRLIANKHGKATAKMCRSVLSGMCGTAARHDALPSNPVKSVGTVQASARKAPRALSIAELRQLRAALTYDDKAVARDLPDLVSFLMATGLRIGEASGLTWGSVDLDAGTVNVRGAAVRLKGQGIVIKGTKRETSARTLLLPRWCVEMLSERARFFDAAPGDPLFPAPLGGWRDPSNTQADLGEAFKAAGFDWVTSHVFRKSVATVMDLAGLSARAAADQLGHANTTMTLNVYMGRQVSITGAAEALEAIGR